MQYANELFFLVSALILWGLVMASLPLIKSVSGAKSDIYWYWSLIFAATAFSLFAIASTVSIALITIANTCFVASHVYLAFFTGSLMRPSIRKWKYLPLFGLLIFGVVFEILRQKGSFVGRVNFVVITSILCLILTSMSLIELGVGKSNQLKFLLITTLIEIVLSSARLVVLYVDSPAHNINLYQEPFLSTLLRLCWFAFQALSYIAIIGYFIEKISVDRTLSMSERKRISDLHQEVLNVNQLLVEKDELFKALNEEKIKSENANQAKSQFLANVSHEIRTPLHGLIGLVSMVMKLSMSDEIRRSLDKVLYLSKALLVILNDILDFSKIEAGMTDLSNEPFKVQQFENDIWDLFSIPANEKGIDLRFDINPATPAILIGDFYKLRQVLFNLVGNSIKFTTRGFVEVKVRVNQLDEQSALVTMIVKDSGIGISENDLKVIFEPFSQLDNTNSRRYDGVGLGLSITQNILLTMGSELVMRSQPGVGSEASFQIRLGLQHRVTDEELTMTVYDLKDDTSLPNNSLAGRHILVAEDNLINIEVMRQYLTYLKIESHFVTDGQECLDALKNNPYDLVLMDIQMPNLDGVNATYQIRRIPELKDLPIIGLSAGVADSDREKGIQSGMSDFLVKPFEVEELTKILMKYLC